MLWKGLRASALGAAGFVAAAFAAAEFAAAAFAGPWPNATPAEKTSPINGTQAVAPARITAFFKPATLWRIPVPSSLSRRFYSRPP